MFGKRGKISSFREKANGSIISCLTKKKRTAVHSGSDRRAVAGGGGKETQLVLRPPPWKCDSCRAYVSHSLSFLLKRITSILADFLHLKGFAYQ